MSWYLLSVTYNPYKPTIGNTIEHCTLLKGVQQDTFVWETSHF